MNHPLKAGVYALQLVKTQLYSWGLLTKVRVVRRANGQRKSRLTSSISGAGVSAYRELLWNADKLTAGNAHIRRSSTSCSPPQIVLLPSNRSDSETPRSRQADYCKRAHEGGARQVAWKPHPPAISSSIHHIPFRDSPQPIS